MQSRPWKIMWRGPQGWYVWRSYTTKAHALLGMERFNRSNLPAPWEARVADFHEAAKLVIRRG